MISSLLLHKLRARFSVPRFPLGTQPVRRTVHVRTPRRFQTAWKGTEVTSGTGRARLGRVAFYSMVRRNGKAGLLPSSWRLNTAWSAWRASAVPRTYGPLCMDVARWESWHWYAGGQRPPRFPLVPGPAAPGRPCGRSIWIGLVRRACNLCARTENGESLSPSYRVFVGEDFSRECTADK